MKKLVYLFILFTTMCTCQENNKTNIESKKMDINEKLIDGLDFNNSVFKKSDLELNKYFFEKTSIENIKLNDLLNKEYRNKFFNFLKVKSSEEDFKITLFVKLLLIRIEQKKDTDSFYLLVESSKEPEISYDGIELLVTVRKFYL